MKIKKFLVELNIFLLVSCGLLSCNTDINDSIEYMKKVFPKSNIYRDNNSSYRFYVVDSSGMKMVILSKIFDANKSGMNVYVLDKVK